MARDKVFDSLKFVLIFLVVLGHGSERYLNSHTDFFREWIYMCIYSFHMPLFIFVSGFFSKNLTWAKFLKSAKMLIPAYILFQALFGMGAAFKGFFTWESFLTKPEGILWYILCLVIWRFIFCFISKYKIPAWVVIPLSFLGGIAIGFCFKEAFWIRAITFLPYFALGYYCTSGIIASIRALNKWMTTGVLAVIFLSLTFYLDIYSRINLFYAIPYARFPFSKDPMIERCVVYLMAMVVSVCVINLITERFAKWGDRTMPIYLLHPTFVSMGYSYIAFTLVLPLNPFIDIAFAVLVTGFLLFLSQFKIIQGFTNPSSIPSLLAQRKANKAKA